MNKVNQEETVRLEKKVRKNNLLYYGSLSVILLAILSVGYIFYLSIFPLEIIKPKTQPYKVLTPIVYQGEQLIYEIDACKFVEVTSNVSRRFVNGVVINLPSVNNNVKKGCFKSPTGVIVPKEVPPGTWYLQLDIEYKVNFLRTATYHFTTEKFLVKEATSSACKK